MANSVVKKLGTSVPSRY